ncbi:MAG: hypothetical protein EOO45_02850 [Flavobacterium sp.]|nr:MAG: hypothetical protein EOO45_02850 [Flavobacterium sp.]
MDSIFIKGTALVTAEAYKNDPTCLGSSIFCAMETWTNRNFHNNGEFISSFSEPVRKKYGEVRTASYALQNDIHNLTTSYHQMVSASSDLNIESGLKGLYLSNLTENYITNMRCIYDYMATFPRILVKHSQLEFGAVSTDSMNALLTFINKDPSRANEIFSQPVVQVLVNLEPSLSVVKKIRDAIIHHGKDPMISIHSGIPHIRIPKSLFNRNENVLPDLLKLQTLDYPLFPYLQYLSRSLFADMDNLGKAMIIESIKKDKDYRYELVALIGICVEAYIGFLYKEF